MDEGDFVKGDVGVVGERGVGGGLGCIGFSGV